MKHTPTPWRVCGNNKCSCKMIWAESTDSHIATARPVACVHGEWGDSIEHIYGENTNVEENAAFIVRAVNCHEQLLEIVKDYLTFREVRGMHTEFTEIIKQAIAKAEGAK